MDHRGRRLPKSLFPSGLPTKILYAFLDSSVRATCPAHLSRLDLRFLIMLGKEYTVYSSALCNFLHYPEFLYYLFLSGESFDYAVILGVTTVSLQIYFTFTV